MLYSFPFVRSLIGSKITIGSSANGRRFSIFLIFILDFVWGNYTSFYSIFRFSSTFNCICVSLSINICVCLWVPIHVCVCVFVTADTCVCVCVLLPVYRNGSHCPGKFPFMSTLWLVVFLPRILSNSVYK